jgi:hypothetical protein
MTSLLNNFEDYLFDKHDQVNNALTNIPFIYWKYLVICDWAFICDKKEVSDSIPNNHRAYIRSFGNN